MLDLAFYLTSGKSVSSLNAFHSHWNDSLSAFTELYGSISFTDSSLVHYNSTLKDVGGWSVRVKTDDVELCLEPLEKLFIREKYKLPWEQYSLDIDPLSESIKPGFLDQFIDFMCSPSSSNLKSISSQLTDFSLFRKIFTA